MSSSAYTSTYEEHNMDRNSDTGLHAMYCHGDASTNNGVYSTWDQKNEMCVLASTQGKTSDRHISRYVTAFCLTAYFKQFYECEVIAYILSSSC